MKKKSAMEQKFVGKERVTNPKTVCVGGYIQNPRLDGCCLVTSLTKLAQHRALFPDKIVCVYESVVASKAMFGFPAGRPSTIPAGN